ncbi:MAG: uracil-DNA glycosylase family protein [Candidatus Thorarchaeota archaeon]
MQINIMIGCKEFPCSEINQDGYLIPNIEIDPEKIKLLMISEVPPENPKDYFYEKNHPFYMETTLQAFRDAGEDVSSIEDIIGLGIYITTAVKCAKIGYSVPTSVIKNCSEILEEEIKLFPNVRAYILLGDVAIRSFNYIAKRISGEKVIPTGSTYKIRYDEFYYKDARVYPSYIITGRNFLIEKSKRKMIAEDIKSALKIIRE